MSVKSLLVPLFDGDSAAATLGSALQLAKTFGAHTEVLHVLPDPTDSIAEFAGESVSPALVEDMIRATEERSQKTAAGIRKAFDAAVGKAKVALAKRPGGQGATAAYVEHTGRADQWLEAEGRVSDLIVIRRPRNASDAGPRMAIETALMGTGRPIVVMPGRRPVQKIGTSVAIAWNGSVEASRAVALALPFLEKAKSVTVISATEDGKPAYDEDSLVAYLRWHGIRAKALTVKEGPDTGQAITRAAGRAKADLLVMGAYTHSRVRELILGGVTNHVVTSASIPVLLAH